MNTFLVVVNIVIFLVIMFGLYTMQKKHVKFSTRVFVGLGVGIVFGIVIHVLYGTSSYVTTTTMNWFSIVGTGYVQFLQMVVMPLVFISIVGAFTKVDLTQNLRKISFFGIGILLVTTGISALLGIGAILGFGLDGIELQAGEAENARNEALVEQVETVEEMTIPKQILSFIRKRQIFHTF